MIKIAITGNIGSGKTTVSEILKSIQYKVCESDKLVKEILESKIVIEKIKATFKNEKIKFINRKGRVDRTKLGNLVFSNKNKLEKLEKIIHPEIWNLQRKFIEKQSKEKIIFFDIPLLFEKKLHKNFDYIFYTYVPFEIQKKRVLKRKNMNEDKFAKIIRYQVNISEIDNKWISLKLNTDSSKKKITKEIKKFLENL